MSDLQGPVPSQSDKPSRSKKKRPPGRPPKSKGGRPTVFTSEVLQKLEQAFAYGCSDAEACLLADIAPATLYNYQIENPEFVERKKLLKNKPILIARQSVITSMMDDGDLALRFLERRKKDEFSLRQEVQHSGGILTVNIEAERKLLSYLDKNPEVADQFSKITRMLKNEPNESPDGDGDQGRVP